jgi:hypothetical protein
MSAAAAVVAEVDTGSRDHHRGEDPSEVVLRARPADLDECGERLELVLHLGHGTRSGVAAVEQQAGDPLGVPVCERDGRRTSLCHPHECEPVEAGVVGHCFEVADPRLQREVGDVPVGEAVAPLVVPDDRDELTDLVEEVPPDGALPVVLEVTEPAGRDKERRALAGDGVRDADAIGRLAEPDLLSGRHASI